MHIFVSGGACTCMWVCLNGKRIFQLVAFRVWTTPRVWTACGAQVPPPPLTNTPAAVYHAGSGVEDSKPAGPHAILSADTHSTARQHVFAKGNLGGNTVVKEPNICRLVFVCLWSAGVISSRLEASNGGRNILSVSLLFWNQIKQISSLWLACRVDSSLLLCFCSLQNITYTK